MVLVAQPSEITPVAMSWVALCSTLAVLAFLILFAQLCAQTFRTLCSQVASQKVVAGCAATCVARTKARSFMISGRGGICFAPSRRSFR